MPRNRERSAWTDRQILDLVREHERLVRSYLRALGCPLDRVDDLAQETFLRLFARPPGAVEPARLRGTLRVTARNLYFNSLRADAARPDQDQVDQAWAEFDGADAGSTYVDALRGCLEHVPNRAREALQLRFGSNLSRGEIASRMQLSLGGVKSLLLRAKQDLRDCVRRKLRLDPVDSLGATR